MLRSRETSDPLLSIGEVSERTGLAVSAIRFYESKGLVSSERAPSGHRRFRKSTIRRLSFVLTSQRLGYSLDEIGDQLARLPDGRTPTRDDWDLLAAGFTTDINERIAGLERLRDSLDHCIGCGCLSLETCKVWNPDDVAATLGSGPQYLLGDAPLDTSGEPPAASSP
mgnify:CR=1 FL=1